MKKAEPIRCICDLNNMKHYWRDEKKNARNNLLLVLGLNSALRISDMLKLTWSAVYDFDKSKYKTHLRITEKKTGKPSLIFINEHIVNALNEYKASGVSLNENGFLFCHKNKNIPISRSQAWRIVREAANYAKIDGVISCHSLRKTFGYHAWKNGISPALLVDIYNHSSYVVTKRYLGINQDERDKVFESMRL